MLNLKTKMSIKYPITYTRVHQLGNKFIWGVLLIILGILFRTVWHLGPNVEYVTAASLLAGVYLGKKYAVLVPLFIMVLSDTLIGNTNIFVFTWSAYLGIGLISQIGQIGKRESKQKILGAAGLGIAASLFFYVWTNFGVWVLDSWGMYPRTMVGLLDCYIAGLPFLKLNLLGNLFFVPVSFGVVEIAKKWGLDKYIQFIYNNCICKCKRLISFFLKISFCGRTAWPKSSIKIEAN